MKYVALACFCLILIIPACAHGGPSYETRQGFDVYLNGQPGPSEEDMEAAIDVAMEIVIAKGIYSREEVEEALRQYADTTTIHLREIEDDMGFWCGRSSPTGYCWGRFWSADRVIEITHQECIATTAIIHELMHWVQWAVTGTVDYMHLNPLLFESACRALEGEKHDACYRNSAEHSGEVQLCIERCGASCILVD